jgi:DNA-directed RNA polymerase specialized sigma24 family protein
MNEVAEDILMHYGMPRRSGRYPWGSGENPYQRSIDFLGRYETLKEQGLKEVEIAKAMNILDEYGKPSTGRLRVQYSYAKDERRIYQVETAQRLRDKEGLGPTEIGRKMDLPESTVRSLLNQHSEARMRQARATADFIRKRIDEDGMIDVGTGVEKEFGVSSEKFKEALYILEMEGYPIYKGGIKTGPMQQTTQRVICKPGTEHKEIYEFDRVHPLNKDQYYSHDGGDTFDKLVYPKSLDSKRVKVLLKDEVGPDGETGEMKDGLIQIRRGVPDLSLGNDRYSQVRILVDDNKYLKGMAVYSDDLPDGVDVLVNSNKLTYEKAFKPITNDPDNPFGSLIKADGQSYYTDKDGNRQLSCINKRASEGDWTEWADALPSQFLSKQPMQLIRKQLNLAKADKLAEFEDICKLTNPTIKKHLLNEFADSCDGAAVSLKAAALPGQKYHVIIPVNTLKDTEIYAPQYEPGTKLALVRYPHGGLFEIPILTVNNRNKTASKIVPKDSVDAVCINKNIADMLSGADFDGDTVMVIPTHDSKGRVKISNRPPLQELEGFDTRMAYPERPGMKYMKDPVTGKDNTQNEMGSISNLITDMTLAGASNDELARAVKHSMVVIDAAKHKLDYKKSEIDNDIATLRKTYQAHLNKNGKVIYGGASTLISRSSGQETVLRRQGSPKVNMKGTDWYDSSKPEGALIWKTADDVLYPDRKYDKTTGMMSIRTADGKKVTYDPKDKEAYAKYNPVKRIDPATGKVRYTDRDDTVEYKTKEKTQKSTKMMEVDDANELMSTYQWPKEKAYAEYANSMKDLANRARKEMMTTGNLKMDKNAKLVYAQEVVSLKEKLREAQLNAPKEREAQRKANYTVAQKKLENPNMKSADEKKERQRALTAARVDVGSVSRKKRNINITDREWDAIQAGAISENVLTQILANADVDKLRERATPRATVTLSTARVNKIKQMANSNYSLDEIARSCGCSTSTVQKYLKGAK